MKQPLGTLLVVSGPSGSGKTTLCRRATENGLCVYSISCTTRRPRSGEVDGVDYHFLTAAEFAARVERGDFLEYAEVHGNRYGTLKADILNLLEQGKNVVMDIDVQGAAQVRACVDGILPKCYTDVYIYVPQEELRNRLCGRQRPHQRSHPSRQRPHITKCIRGGEIIVWGAYPKHSFVPHVYISRTCRGCGAQ